MVNTTPQQSMMPEANTDSTLAQMQPLTENCCWNCSISGLASRTI